MAQVKDTTLPQGPTRPAGVTGFGSGVPAIGLPTMAEPKATPNAQYAPTYKSARQQMEEELAGINRGPMADPMIIKGIEDQIRAKYAPLIQKESSTAKSGYSMSGPAVQKVASSVLVPAKTGSKPLDKGIKTVDAKGTDVKKLESFWDRASRFFTGGQPQDVTIWDFLEATGKAMAKDSSASSREKRLGTAREDELIKADLASKKAEREAQYGQQTALQKMADQSAWDRLQEQKRLVNPPTPGMVGANLFPGAQ